MSTTTARKRFAFKSGSREHVENTRQAMKNLEPFEASSLTGFPINHFPGFGQLNDDERGKLKRAIEQKALDYVVYSYSTPIAWHITMSGYGFWRIVDQKFSPTTSIQQGFVRNTLRDERMLP